MCGNCWGPKQGWAAKGAAEVKKPVPGLGATSALVKPPGEVCGLPER